MGSNAIRETSNLTNMSLNDTEEPSNMFDITKRMYH